MLCEDSRNGNRRFIFAFKAFDIYVFRVFKFQTLLPHLSAGKRQLIVPLPLVKKFQGLILDTF